MNRDIQQLLRKARKAGCTVSMTRRGHYRITSPDGRNTVGAPHSPSDYRSVREVRAKLRRIGITV